MNRILTVFVATACLLKAQQMPLPPRFDAVSIKADNSGSGSSSDNDDRGLFRAMNVSLRTLILRAYELKTYQLSTPSWMDDVRFDVMANYPPDTVPTDIQKMKQMMMVERFGLALHHESREAAVFELVVMKSGIRFLPARPDETESSNTNGRAGIYELKAIGIGMPQLCAVLSRYLVRPVFDMTNLAGSYDLALKWASEAAQRGDNSATVPELPAAIEEQLGLKLEPRKRSLSLVVIDHAEKTPTEN